MYNKINEAYKYIFEQYSQPIDIAIILGSGLGPLADPKIIAMSIG